MFKKKSDDDFKRIIKSQAEKIKELEAKLINFENLSAKLEGEIKQFQKINAELKEQKERYKSLNAEYEISVHDYKKKMDAIMKNVNTEV